MKPDTIFNYLTVGLAASSKESVDIPIFRWACHYLSLAMSIAYPKTRAALFQLFEQPLKDWYPLSIPKRFDSDFGFLYDGELSEEASDYYYSLEDQDSSPIKQYLSTENSRFRELLDHLRRNHEEDPKTTQREYIYLRQFLISNPFSTGEQISRAFIRCRYVSPKQVGSLYEMLPASTSSQDIWQCDRCGPLRMKRGELRGVKPSVCNDHRKRMEKVSKVEWSPQLRQLTRALHLRLLIPGIPEIGLFEAIDELRDPSMPGLIELQLYPSIDYYDLLLRFSDGVVWAVDMKDYPNPLKLTRKLVPLNGSGELRFDEGFYVVPQIYLARTENYLSLAQSSTGKKVRLLSDRQFQKRVLSRVEQLRRGT